MDDDDPRVMTDQDQRNFIIDENRRSRPDRALSAIIGLAIGDALGAPHEFQPPLPAEFEPTMSGGGVWEPGEWTDDTSMAICILQAWEKHGEFGSEESLDTLVALWVEWAKSAPDVGIQTRKVLSNLSEPTAAAARKAAEELHLRTGKTAGNGSLMRTAPIALLDVEYQELARIARAVSSLTHFDEDAGDACALWTLAIRSAIEWPEVDFQWGLDELPLSRRRVWEKRISDAKGSDPSSYKNNGWVVSAFEAALAAVYRGGHDFEEGVKAAVRCGNDTDTVAAIAGALLGAQLSPWWHLPEEWTMPLHGWPGLTGIQLADLAESLTSHLK
jgi:ADP-ribosyl-[dinitrogen reductase] hydrolase